MLKKYTREQFWGLYKTLPQELKDALFSEEAGDNIASACERNEIPDDARGDIVDLVGQVLTGVLPAEDFQSELEKELKIKKEIAKKAAQEINRFVFYPVKPALDQLHGMETNKSIKKPGEEKKTEEKPTELKKDDIYKEPLE